MFKAKIHVDVDTTIAKLRRNVLIHFQLFKLSLNYSLNTLELNKTLSAYIWTKRNRIIYPYIHFNYVFFDNKVLG